MNLIRTFVIPSNVMSRAVGSETVLLDLASGTYFGLDPVGTRVWQLLEQGKSIGEICDVIVSEFDVTHDVIERDALALVRQLEEKQLITTI
jgi:hypothetical protein